jgi:hypothetical protein
MSTYVDNTPTPAPQSDVGFKISKPNFDASTSPPQDLLFSSSWPSLAIAFSTTITDITPYTDTAAGYAIPHGLGFPPLAFYWAVTDVGGTAVPGTVYTRNIATVDSQYVYIGYQTGTSLHIKAYNIDLRKDIDYTSYPGADQRQPYDANYGIKMVKPGKDINSKDMRDFIIHSRCQTPLVQAVKTEKTANPANTFIVQYTNKLAFPTWVYGFVREQSSASAPLSNADCFEYAPFDNQAFPKTVTDGFTSYILMSGSNGATIVALRDPMFAGASLTEQY